MIGNVSNRCKTLLKIYIPIIFTLTLNTGYAAKPTPAKAADKKVENQQPAPDRYVPLTADQIEQNQFNLLKDSLKAGDIANWPEEKSPTGETTKVLLVESPYQALTERGDMLVLAAPGQYPYQANWYLPLRDALTDYGWNLLSVGIQPSPVMNEAPSRQELSAFKDKTTSDINTDITTKFSTELTSWTSKAISRSRLLLSFSQSRDKPHTFLIAEGLSAHIVGLAAGQPSSQLSGLVLLNLRSPTLELQKELEETLSSQGPILDILFNPTTQERQAAMRRRQGAVKAGNKEYRVEFAPSGMFLNNASATWLALTINAWARAIDMKP